VHMESERVRHASWIVASALAAWGNGTAAAFARGMETSPASHELPPIFDFEKSELFQAARRLGGLFVGLEVEPAHRRWVRLAADAVQTILTIVGSMTLPQRPSTRLAMRNRLRQRVYRLNAIVMSLQQAGAMSAAMVESGRALVHRCDELAAVWMREPPADAVAESRARDGASAMAAASSTTSVPIALTDESAASRAGDAPAPAGESSASAETQLRDAPVAGPAAESESEAPAAT